MRYLVVLVCLLSASAHGFFDFGSAFQQFFPFPMPSGFPSSSPAETDPENSPGTTCNCGTSNRRRIVGGSTTQANEYPFMLSIVFAGTREHFCGAAILTETRALTAAHCTNGVTRSLSVLAGAHHLRRFGGSIQESRVARVIQHERYSQGFRGVHNDIAILVLRTPLQFNANVVPVCMPDSKLNLENEPAKIIGWGRLGDGLPTASTLQEIDVRIHTAQECRRRFPQFNPDTMICSGNPGVTACNGDSGGPVIWLDSDINRWTLVGLVSYGQPGCKIGIPTVQTDVSSFISWIESKIESPLCQKK